MAEELNRQQAILRSVAEDMKVPLLQILTHVQLGKMSDKYDASYIETTAEAAMRLLDSYVVSTQIYSGQHELALQPTSVAASMYDASQYLSRYAKLHSCEVELEVARSTGLVMANPAVLQAAFTSLGYGLINALSQYTRKQTIIFAAKKTSTGIQAGVYAPELQISQETLQRARALQGRARHSLGDIAQGSSAGIYIADILLEAMSAPLRVGRVKSRPGLMTTLLPSQQLALL